MAEAAALVAIRWIASPIITKFIKHASTYLGKDVARELEDLEAVILPQFQLVIEAAEKSPHKGKLELWLQKLKATFHDAEDLLDEHEYDVLKREVEKGKGAPSVLASSSHAILKPLRAASSKLSNLHSKNRKLLIKLDQLKKILAEAKNFHDLLGLKVGNTLESKATAQIGPQANATSLPTSKVFGRDKDRDHIIDLLCKPDDAEVSAAAFSSLAIIGLGGMGKTTLAQYVYNDQRVAKYFDARMWVCIARKLDMHRHTQEIIESATNGECPCVSNFDTLQCKLRDLLQKSENFLLVLDDVWFDESRNEMEWEQLLAPLVSHKGGKILVTSRQKTLPVGLQCKDIISLQNMEDSEFLALFKEHAFSGAKVRDPLLYEKLEEIAQKIAQRLGKSPLAAKAVGSQLSREKNIVAWKAASNEKNLSEPMKALLWSYERLDPRLQRCFLYCSLFPKGHK